MPGYLGSSLFPASSPSSSRHSSRIQTPSSSQVRYAMLKNDGTLGPQQMPWYTRIWAAITWVFFAVIFQCQKRIFGIDDNSQEEVEYSHTRTNSAQEALELVPEEAIEAKEINEPENVEIGHPKNNEAIRNKDRSGKKASTGLFSKVKKRVEEKIEVIRNSDIPSGKTNARKESLTNELIGPRGDGPGPSTSFERIVSKGVSAGKAFRETFQNLNERGERLNAANDTTERLSESSRGYASTSSALLAKYKSKDSLFG